MWRIHEPHLSPDHRQHIVREQFKYAVVKRVIAERDLRVLSGVPEGRVMHGDMNCTLLGRVDPACVIEHGD